MLAGGLLALVHAFFAIHLRADQIVSGTAINFLALGLTGYLFIAGLRDERHADRRLRAIPDVTSRSWTACRSSAQVFGQLNLMIWLASLLIVSLVSCSGRRSGCGSARSASIRGRPTPSGSTSTRSATRPSSSRACSPRCGGAYLSIGFVNSFNENMTAGRGFIALAALIFGNWRPFGAAAACLLFGFSSALAQRLARVLTRVGSPSLFQALPYVLTLIAVAGVIGRSIPPAADGRPYKRQ